MNRTGETNLTNSSRALDRMAELLGKEMQLQAITDAWNSRTLSMRIPNVKANVESVWPELAAAIKDALTKEET